MARTRFLAALIALGALLVAIPAHAASYAYIGQGGATNQLNVFDADTGTPVTTISLPQFPVAIAVNAKGNRIYVVSFSDMYVIDPLTFTVIDTVPGVGGNPAGV